VVDWCFPGLNPGGGVSYGVLAQARHSLRPCGSLDCSASLAGSLALARSRPCGPSVPVNRPRLATIGTNLRRSVGYSLETNAGDMAELLLLTGVFSACLASPCGSPRLR